jgi:uncharacterized protein involved in outer membrane biogenesis
VAGLAIVVLGLGLTLALPLLFESDPVRRALEAQATAALATPVRIGSLGVRVFPRVAIRLERVSIGEPPAIAVERASLATGLVGLWQRRVEEAEVRVGAARLRLPLPGVVARPAPAATPPPPRAPGPPPAAGPPPGDPAAAPAPPALTVVSVRSVTVDGLEIEAGGRTARLAFVGRLEGERLEVTRLDLAADGTRLTGAARLTSFRALDGTFTIDATTLDLDALLALGAALTAPAAPAAAPVEAPPPREARPAAPPGPGGPAPTSAPTGARLDGTLRAASGAYRGIAFRDLAGRLGLRGREASLDPVQLRLLGGRYEGRVSLGLAGQEGARVSHEGRLQEIDLAEVSTALGAPGTASGTLAVELSLAGAGGTLEAAARHSAGRGTVRITDLRVKGLDLLETALGFLGESGEATRSAPGPSRLTGTLAIGDERVATQDLLLESPAFGLRGKGALGVRGTLDFTVDLVLSEALSARVRGSAARYVKEGQRIVLPMKVAGSVRRPEVSIDAVALAGRAAGAAAGELGKKLEDRLREELGKLLRRRK